MFRHFIGGRIDAVLLKLLLLSIFLGVALSFFDVDPYDIWNRGKILFLKVYNMGFGAVEWLFQYFLLGAIIVIPLWFLGRLWSFFFNKPRY